MVVVVVVIIAVDGYDGVAELVLKEEKEAGELLGWRRSGYVWVVGEIVVLVMLMWGCGAGTCGAMV